MRSGAYAYVHRAPRGRLAALAILAAVLLGALAWLAVRLARSQAPEPAWQRAESADGGYSALFPAPPRSETRQVATGAGPLQVHFLIAETPESAYMVSYTDYPAAALVAGPEPLLDGVRDGAVTEIGGELVREIPIGFAGGHPGRQLTIDVPERKEQATLRCYLVGRRLYQLLQVGDRGADSDTRDRFLASFQLAGPAPVPP